MNKQYKQRNSSTIKVIKKGNSWNCSCSNERTSYPKAFATKSLSDYAKAIGYLQQIEEREIEIMISSSMKVSHDEKK